MDNKLIDFYKILNIDKNATKKEIKSAYRKLILIYHPDKNKNIDSSEMFNKIHMAYEILIDEKKREKYDSFDNINNSPIVKNIFVYYYELVIEKCHQCKISEEDKEIIIGLFNPEDFEEEIKARNINIIYQKIFSIIFPLILRNVVINICKEYSISESETTEIIALVNFDDYKIELKNGDFNSIYQKIIDKIIAHLPKFLIKRATQDNSFFASTLNLLLLWFG
jgi:curved DNA-binding protein CbpA